MGVGARMIRFNVSLNVDIDKIERDVRRALQKAQVVLDEQVLKDSNYFIPMDTHALEMSGVRASRIGEGIITWDTPYARRLYYNPQYNFSKDQNPNARGLWFEEAKAAFGSDWVRAAQAELDNNI